MATPMHRFTVSHLFMATALIAISLTFIQSEGCGSRYSKIGCLRFSPDGRLIAVARYDARDANVSLKAYLADISRTVSLLDAKNGSTQWVADSRVKPGNAGPALFEYRRVQADIGFGRERLILREFGGSALSAIDYTAKLPGKSLSIDGYSLVVFADGQFVLARGLESTCLYSLTKSKPLWNVGRPRSGMPAALAASEKSGLFAAVCDDRVDIGEIATGRLLTDKGTSLADHSQILKVAFALDGRKLVLAKYDAIALFDIDCHEIKTLSLEETAGEMAVSPSGVQLAFASGWGFKVRDLENNRLVFGKSDDNIVTALCFSPDGSQLAVGDAKGRVTCFDTASWKAIWATRASGHYAPPWTLPAGLLVGWIWVLRRLMRHPNETQTAE